MDRSVIMVDAGYLYAAGGQLCCGTRSRADLVLNASLFVQRLADRVRTGLALQVLRTYWYDAARDGIRTEEQQTIAGQHDVKLRLGRLNGQNQQKGVDALIYRDMITLAQHRAVADIVLVSGDEDLHEGVRTVQDYGVRVVLVGIEAVTGFNQSRELVYEADRLWTLSADDLHGVFDRRGLPQSTSAVTQGEPAVRSTSHRATHAAVAFATQWRDQAEETELMELLSDRPRIPRPLDIELLTAVEREIGQNLRNDEQLKRNVRAAWWGVIGGGHHSAQ
ncbi:NYN domain-containing protein [Kibdelosporangium persicum]|uniref:NYN domain-containing protein n=1 Tax=Kibdelosporangium persicum TaxID=2698649 RepID=UPI0015666F11|nr:NYN domain-containing protein [Kibdelosporangium persicum]